METLILREEIKNLTLLSPSSSAKALDRFTLGEHGIGRRRSAEFKGKHWHKNKWEQTNHKAGNEVFPQGHEVLEQPSRRRMEFKNTPAFKMELVQSLKGLRDVAAPNSRGKAEVGFGEPETRRCCCRTGCQCNSSEGSTSAASPQQWGAWIKSFRACVNTVSCSSLLVCHP